MKYFRPTRLIISAVLFMTFVPLFGCARGATVPEAQTQNDDPQYDDNPHPENIDSKSILGKLRDKDKIVYFALGDSLTEGLYSDNQSSNFYMQFPELITREAQVQVTSAKVAEVGKTVSNFGIQMVQQVINYQPDLVTIGFGTNDAAYGVDATNLGNFETNMNSLIKQLKDKTKAQIVLLTTWSSKDGKYLENDKIYDQKIKDIAKKNKVAVADLSTLWKEHPELSENGNGYSEAYQLQKDNMHPNQQGHNEIAELLFETISKNKAQ